tara:strand:+ start:58 stop:384 length:327 start_codon:yes stop_codon:yes gene_type:complete
MKNITTNQTKFTVEHSFYNETAGMVKGKFRTRSLIKVLNNGVLVSEFTREFPMAWICILDGVNGVVDIECKKSEASIKRTMMWGSRKNSDMDSILIKIEMENGKVNIV